jgi:predicted AAA+ superfamily ATPase
VNLGKRQVKSPKIYLRDTGLLHALLGVPQFRALEGHPKVGASWEGFVVEEVVRAAGERNCYFWATQSGAELDVLVTVGGKPVGVEIKYGDAPGMTKSMHIAIDDLNLSRLLVVYPGSESYPLNEKTLVIPLARLGAELRGRRA